MEISVEAVRPIEGISPYLYPKNWSFSAPNTSARQKTDVLELSTQSISNDQAMRILFERVLNQVNSLFSSNNQEFSLPIDILLDDSPSAVGNMIAEWSLSAFDSVVPSPDPFLSVLPGAIQSGAGDATTIFEELGALTPVLQQNIDTALQAALSRLNELSPAHVKPKSAE